jgi:NADPH:quinone reductase-like Zn-dependent oxidoreductase
LYNQNIIKMKAIVLKQPGGVENLEIRDIPVPDINDHEVLVEVKAISINPVDAIVRENAALLSAVLRLKEGERPVILGWDISGIVTATGKSVSRFKKGDAVFGMVNFEGHGKAYAEYVAAPEAHLAHKPANISYEEAAAATLAALTAWQSLATYTGVKAGDKVLIHAAAGGVGHYAIQIAKHFGAYVIGTSSVANKDFVLGLGADQHIDYRDRPFEEVVKDADIVVDSIGQLDRSLDALKEGGTLISLVVPLDKNLALAKKAKAKKVSMFRLGVESSEEDMEAIAGLLRQGALHSHVSATYSFHEMAAAHQQIEAGRTRGKIIVTIP